MKKFRRPKTVRLSLEKRVLMVQQVLIAEDKKSDYMIGCLERLFTLLRIQDEELQHVYDKLVEMAMPRYVKLWRWVKGKVKRGG